MPIVRGQYLCRAQISFRRTGLTRGTTNSCGRDRGASQQPGLGPGAGQSALKPAADLVVAILPQRGDSLLQEFAQTRVLLAQQVHYTCASPFADKRKSGSQPPLSFPLSSGHLT